jgi:exopolyphosphatase/guanosine-5'-triphosphate,3'-diphosphate pyrophosphatase
MTAAFQELNIKVMMPGEGALRAGVLYDLLGRDSEHDKRDETVRQFIKRYQVDTRQANRVKHVAQTLFSQVKARDEAEKQELNRTLGWAADLHEVGMTITHAQYHKHSAYVLQHADMPGFSNDDQALLALFALGHQGKVNKLKSLHPSRLTWRALLCLRLAVLLSRRREDLPTLPISIKADGKRVRLLADKSWLEKHPLSEYSLLREQENWTKSRFEIELVETDSRTT